MGRARGIRRTWRVRRTLQHERNNYRRGQDRGRQGEHGKAMARRPGLYRAEAILLCHAAGGGPCADPEFALFSRTGGQCGDLGWRGDGRLRAGGCAGGAAGIVGCPAERCTQQFFAAQLFPLSVDKKTPLLFVPIKILLPLITIDKSPAVV